MQQVETDQSGKSKLNKKNSYSAKSSPMCLRTPQRRARGRKFLPPHKFHKVSLKQISRGTSHSLQLTLCARQRTLDILGSSFHTRVDEMVRMVDGQVLIAVRPNLAVSCPLITNHCTSWLDELLNNWHQCSDCTVLDLQLHEECSFFFYPERFIPRKTQTPSRMTPTIVTQYFRCQTCTRRFRWSVLAH